MNSRTTSCGPIALFVPTLSFGGVERTALHLCRGLLEAGFTVDLVAANARGELQGAVPEAARLFDLRARRVLTSLPALARYLRRERPQAVIAFMTHCNVIAVWARRMAAVRTRVIATEHVPISIMGRGSRRWRVKLAPLLARWFLPRADEVVAVSAAVADDLASHLAFPRQRITVVPNPVLTPELFREAALPVAHPWFKADAPPVVLAVGRLAKTKDHATLLRAFALLRRREQARLLVLGEGEERQELEKLAASLGIAEDVALPGYEPSPYRFMAHAALFVLSSRWEGFGLVLVEALACGAKVISTDCPGGPREILEGDRLGTLVPVGDPEALAGAMADALGTAAAIVSRAMLKQYELQPVVEQYARLMRIAPKPNFPSPVQPEPCASNLR